MEESDHRYLMFTDRHGVEQFRVEFDDHEHNQRTIMTVPLDEVRHAIERFDIEKGGGEVYQRAVRITNQPGNTYPYGIDIRDADTGEFLPGVVKATIYLDARHLNRVEMDYYETDREGNITGQKVRKSINGIAEIDVTAHEVKRKP